MKHAIPAIVCAAALLLPSNLVAQGADPNSSSPTASGTRNPAPMDEDIEVLRRLLTSKLESQYEALKNNRNLLVWECASCHGGNDSLWLNRYTLLSNPYQSVQPFYQESYHRGYNTPWQYPTLNNPALDWWSPQTFKSYSHGVIPFHSSAPALDVEGVYLRGFGVIYTLNLPLPLEKPRTEAVKISPPPVSDWDRVRREVRNEKPQPEPKKPEPARPPQLEEILLKVLAENGHHLAQLGTNEVVMIVVTFREPVHSPKGSLDLGFPLNMQNRPSDPVKSKNPNPPQPTASPADPKPATQSTSDYELLGDLHQKQGKLEEATRAFLQAIEMKPDAAHLARLYRKLAAVYLAAGKDQEARQALDRAMAIRTSKEENTDLDTANKAQAPSALPAKLIVSAPRKLLEDVGAGRMPFEEFRHAAKVERVNFPAGLK